MIMEEEEEWDPRSQQGEDKEEEMGESHQLSLHSIGGFTTQKSLKW